MEKTVEFELSESEGRLYEEFKKRNNLTDREAICLAIRRYIAAIDPDLIEKSAGKGPSG